MITLQQLAEAIVQRAEGRYDVQFPDALELGLPEVDYDSQVVRLRRASIVAAGWRTILLIETPLISIQAAHQWAADVRDVLPEPETSDLYMFLVAPSIPDDEAARIETDDRFCRKIVVRDSEGVMGFLDRTFLASLDPAGDLETLSDPLASALNSLSITHPWTEPHLPEWRAQLLTTTNGAELARLLSESLKGSEDQQ